MEGGFAMTLTQNNSKSSGKSIIRKIPLDITFAQKKIGKGAFGFVKLARRRSDGLDVVVKFIR